METQVKSYCLLASSWLLGVVIKIQLESAHISYLGPFTIIYSGTSLNWSPLGPMKVSLLEGWPHFRGEFVLKNMFLDFSKWPEYRGGHISWVLIRGVPLYFLPGT